MRTQAPIVCLACKRYLHGRSAYLHHSCATSGVCTVNKNKTCLLYPSLTGQQRVYKGKPLPAWRMAPSMAAYLLPPPERGSDGKPRMPSPFPTQMVTWPPARIGMQHSILFHRSPLLRFPQSGHFTDRPSNSLTLPTTTTDNHTGRHHPVVDGAAPLVRNEWYHSAPCLASDPPVTQLNDRHRARRQRQVVGHRPQDPYERWDPGQGAEALRLDDAVVYL